MELTDDNLKKAAQTLISDQQLADYFCVDIDEIRSTHAYKVVQEARATTQVFLRNKLLEEAMRGNLEATLALNKQLT